MNEETSTTDIVQPIEVTSWTQTIIRPSLIILMVTAMMGAVFSVAKIIAPSPNWTYAFLISFFVILESYFTTSWLNHPDRRHLHHLKYRAAEILVLAVIIRILTWIIQGNWPQSGDFIYYLLNPVELFVDGYFWAILILNLIAWQRTSAISQSFLRMRPDAAELAYYQLPRNEREAGNQPISDDRSYLLQNYAQQFLGGGLIVLLCAALASFNLSELPTLENSKVLGITRLGLSPLMLSSLLLYFLCGFLLLSQGRLAILEMRWLSGDAKLQTPIGRHWHRRTLFVLLGIGLIAAFLPIGSTLPFMRILNVILYGIISTITAVLYIISLIIYFFFALFFPQGNEGEVTSPPPPPAPPQELPPIETSAALQYLFSSAFWAIAIIAILIAFTFFLRDRGVRINNTTLQRIWLTLKLWWQQLRRGFNDQMQDIQGGLQSIFQRSPQTDSEKQPPWRFIRVNALSPREKVRYFYLSTVKRANQQGVTRQESETPLEFVEDLKKNWPEAEEEIEELTDAFLQAQYSQSNISEKDITPIKKQWKQLKSNLRKRKKNSESN